MLTSGHRTNHVLHLLLTLFTLGLWAFVWLIIGLTNKEKRDVVTVDEYAQVFHQY